jgi:pimeloyl-[acyl-carrier protein] methyl ester esterase
MNAELRLDCLLLHGWGFNAHVWSSFSEDLNIFSAVDAPCLYAAAKKTKDGKVESLANALNEKVNRDCVVIAWSLGGLIATRLARMTKQVKAIVYLASPPCFVNKENWRNVLAGDAITSLKLSLLNDPKACLQYFSGLVAHGEENPKQMIKLFREYIASEQDVAILLVWLEELLVLDQRKELAALDIPVLQLFGKRDALVNAGVIKNIRLLKPGIEFGVIGNCGHALFISQPKKTIQAINKFINE